MANPFKILSVRFPLLFGNIGPELRD